MIRIVIICRQGGFNGKGSAISAVERVARSPLQALAGFASGRLALWGQTAGQKTHGSSAEHQGKLVDVDQRRVVLPAFDSADVAPAEIDFLAEPFLGQLTSLTGTAYPVAEFDRYRVLFPWLGHAGNLARRCR